MHTLSAQNIHIETKPFDNTEFGKRRGRLERALWVFHQFVAESGTYVVLIGCVINNHKEYSRRKKNTGLEKLQFFTYHGGILFYQIPQSAKILHKKTEN